VQPGARGVAGVYSTEPAEQHVDSGGPRVLYDRQHERASHALTPAPAATYALCSAE
jgi:hypothetical protein